MSRAAALPVNHPVAAAATRAGVSLSLVVQRHKGWAKVHEEGRCRMCLRPSAVRPLTRHHLVPQSWFRGRPKFAPLRHSEANIVPLCEPCHREVEMRDAHARVELRRLLGASEIAFVLQVVGRAWLDKRYPPGQREIAETLRQDEAARRVYARRRRAL